MAVNLKILDQLPDGPAIVETSRNCFETRRFSERDIAFLRSNSQFLSDIEKMADNANRRGEGLTSDEWSSRPESVSGYCCKCHSDTVFKKGDVVEFGVRGVYICDNCEYAFPPDCNE